MVIGLVWKAFRVGRIIARTPAGKTATKPVVGYLIRSKIFSEVAGHTAGRTITGIAVRTFDEKAESFKIPTSSEAVTEINTIINDSKLIIKGKKKLPKVDKEVLIESAKKIYPAMVTPLVNGSVVTRVAKKQGVPGWLIATIGWVV